MGLPDREAVRSTVRRDIAIVVVVAVAFRALYLALYHGSPFYHVPVVDASTFRLWAQALHEGHAFMPGVYFKPPLYPWLLAALMGVVGGALTPVYVLQALVGVATCVFTLALGRRIFTPRVALEGAVICGLLPVLPFLEFQLLAESWTTAMMMAALVMLPPRPWPPGRTIAAGLLLGVAALGRPNLLLVPAFLAVGMAWPFSGRGRLAPAMVLVLATCVGIAPATLHNLAQGHAVLVSANAGANLWAGIRPGADGTSAIPIGIQWDDLQRQSAQAGARDAADASRYLIGRTLHEAAQRPLRALGLLARKALLLVNAHEGRNNIGPTYLARHEGVVVLRRWWPGFWLVAPFALLGLVTLARPAWFAAVRPPGAVAPLLLTLAALTASIVPFFVNARFRQPLLPVLALLAAYGLGNVLAALRAGGRSAIRAGAGLLVLALVVNVDWFGVGRAETGARDELNLAGILAKGWAGHPADPEAALARYATAARLDPDDPDASEREGLERQSLAIDLLQRAEKAGQTGADAGRFAAAAADQLHQAVALHQRAIALFPDAFRSYGGVASSRSLLGRIAARQVEGALAAVDSTAARQAAVVAIHEMEDAVAAWQAALRLKPDLPGAHENLAACVQQIRALPALDPAIAAAQAKLVR